MARLIRRGEESDRNTTRNAGRRISCGTSRRRPLVYRLTIVSRPSTTSVNDGATYPQRRRIRSEHDEDRREENILRDIASKAARLSSDDRLATLNDLRQRWRDLSAESKNQIGT